jgi:hypothetical protein
MWRLRTPVAFLVFNRPETTERVFESIRAARPPRLLVVADGPRPDRPGEAERCRQVRAIVEQVDWPCEVARGYSDVNLGCRRRISSGLDWVFREVEEAIVLEDDCLPERSFYRYCEELLARYRDHERVMVVSGTSYDLGARRDAYSYRFSRYPHVWGWASWRRAWRRYAVDMGLWPAFRDGGELDRVHDRRLVRRFWRRMFDETHARLNDTWDYQLAFACQATGGLSITPCGNLVRNIGFGPAATRTRRKNLFADMPTQAMDFPLRHPPQVLRDAKADVRTENVQYIDHSLPGRVTQGWWKFLARRRRRRAERRRG